MFRQVLQDLERNVEGTLAVSLIGTDGIAIESLKNDEFPLDTLSAELTSFLKTLRTARTDLDTGELEQFVMMTDKYITFLSRVTGEYFILMVLSRQGNYGRARFELRRARFALQDELS
jgi:predicted regulator of Ras-like GTPase activity (Roadblock/LC7/MglB family)